jgi:hypothetical protein
MRTHLLLFLTILTLGSCRFSKSVQVNLISGLTTHGELISCNDVYLTVNDQKIDYNTFIYGEKFYLNFNNIEGFKKEDGKVYPGMSLLVTSKTGDTMLQSNDLYERYSNGISLSPLLLNANLTVATPIHSSDGYTLTVKLWDKKDKGTFTARLDFKVTPNSKLAVEPVNVKYKEIYIFSKEQNKVITDNRIRLNESIYLILEGLTGFIETEGKVYPGLSMQCTDNSGKSVLNEKDLFESYDKTGIGASDFTSQVLSNLVFSSPDVKSPVHCTVMIWDKKSDAKIKVTTDYILEQ